MNRYCQVSKSSFRDRHTGMAMVRECAAGRYQQPVGKVWKRSGYFLVVSCIGRRLVFISTTFVLVFG